MCVAIAQDIDFALRRAGPRPHVAKRTALSVAADAYVAAVHPKRTTDTQSSQHDIVELAYVLTSDAPRPLQDEQGRDQPGCGTPAVTEQRSARLAEKVAAASARWLDLARNKDWESVAADLSVYRFCGETLTTDPRRTQAYKDSVLAVLGLADADQRAQRYPQLSVADVAALVEVAARCAAAFWVEDTPRTTVRHMAHDTIPTGPPVRTPPHRLSTEDSQWVEDQILQEVRRGQLERGLSEWGSPPFPTKAVVPAHQRARKRRMVVDYRRVNARTRRALYYVRRADDVKQECAGSLWYTFLDACAGFNQIANTERARKMLAILARSGQYLPRCLTFGPHNGPEDFAYAVDRIFTPAVRATRRYCREWQAYADDITVRTGRYLEGTCLSDTEYAARIGNRSPETTGAASPRPTRGT